MKIRVLGCYGAELLDYGTSGFLIDDSFMLDAGTICSRLTLAEQRKIRYILVSHIHADHIKGLPSFLDNMGEDGSENPVTIVGVPEIIHGLQAYFFNNQIWPDFTKIPNAESPAFRLKTIPEGRSSRIGGLDVTPFSVNHTVPATGFLLRQGERSFLYSSDTYQTDAIWVAAKQDPHLKAVFLEVSFPDSMPTLAKQSKHLTPELLLKEFEKIAKPDIRLYPYHMKPRYIDTIRKELEQLNFKNMTILKDNMVFHI